MNEEFYCSLFEKIPEGLIISDRSGKILIANPVAEEVFGYKKGELEGLQISDLVPPQKRDVHEKHREDYYHHPEKRLMGKGRHLEGQKKDGSVFPVEVSLNYFENEEGERLVISSVIDITERLRDQNLKETSIIEVQEKERERLAQELHDGVTQTLTAINMNHQALPENVDPQLMGDLKQLTNEAIQEVRGISHRLMPPSLDHQGPLEAIQNMLSRVERQGGIHTEFDTPAKLERLPSKVELTLYRVCQEAVNNVIKHAQANSVRIQIQEKNDEGVHFKIGDDGVGISENEGSGIGMTNIHRRVAAFDGGLKISSAQGKGTTIEGFLPFKMELHRTDEEE